MGSFAPFEGSCWLPPPSPAGLMTRPQKPRLRAPTCSPALPGPAELADAQDAGSSLGVGGGAPGAGLGPPGRGGGTGASAEAGTRHHFRLWRPAVGGAPRQQLGSCAVSPRRRGAEGAQGPGTGTGRPAARRSGRGAAGCAGRGLQAAAGDTLIPHPHPPCRAPSMRSLSEPPSPTHPHGNAQPQARPPSPELRGGAHSPPTPRAPPAGL